jgi:glycosyltransferase involved in cell wall biosynthesis
MTRHVAEPWSGVKSRLYSSWTDRIIPVSEAVATVLEDSGVPRNHLLRAKAGCPVPEVTETREAVRRTHGFREFTFGVFGRLDREKGVDVAIRAAGESGSVLAVVGQGSRELELKALNEACGGPAQFLGFVVSVGNVMNAVDAVIIPSRWAEAFPFVALEAMALSKPIVAARTGGLLELVDDEVNGLLFQRESAQELSECLMRLRSDPDFALKLGREGALRHSIEFSLEKMAERMEAAYAEALRT